MSHQCDLHLENIVWSSKIHQRRVAASLVQGAYNMESERHGNNKIDMEKAAAIGERLGFEISDRLIDAEDGSYFATVYKFKYSVPDHSDSETVPPKYVIAFRGTCLDPETLIRDILSDFEFIFHELHRSRRCETALDAVSKIISLSGGPENVWLAGHSLGSATALLVGRTMVIEKGVHMKTFLFNPPFVAVAGWEPLNHVYWFGRTMVTTVAEMLVHRHSQSSDANNKNFDKLKAWRPNLFVNKKDMISNGYICYFEQRLNMNMIGASQFEIIATQNSVISLFGELVGEHREPIHLIPSANLMITKGSRLHPRKAHGIKQWWQNADLPIIHSQHCL